METKMKHPGVYIPPPLIYVLIFLVSIFLQKLFPYTVLFFKTVTATILGCILVALGLIFILPAVVKFVKSRNTLIPIKPANSLQSDGIYSLTRNPMYLGLLFLYTGIAFFTGNWWTFILIPVVIVVVTAYVIKREEKYLYDAFGQEFTAYTAKVRRWI